MTTIAAIFLCTVLSTDVDPPPPVEFTEGDAAMLDEMVAQVKLLGLPRGMETSLASKLARAAASIRRDQDAAAAGQLQAFLAELEAQSGKNLTEELVREGTAAVNAILFEEADELPPLEFPVAVPSDIERMADFGIPDWSGEDPHNGIDLVVDGTLPETVIVSPVRGYVRSIRVSENPFSDPVNQLLLTVEIFVSYEWTVALVFEPSTVDDALELAQVEALEVLPGETVEAGQVVGSLLVGDLGYPHLHYALLRNGAFVCAYTYSSEAARTIFEELAATSGGEICRAESGD